MLHRKWHFKLGVQPDRPRSFAQLAWQEDGRLNSYVAAVNSKKEELGLANDITAADIVRGLDGTIENCSLEIGSITEAELRCREVDFLLEAIHCAPELAYDPDYWVMVLLLWTYDELKAAFGLEGCEGRLLHSSSPHSCTKRCFLARYIKARNLHLRAACMLHESFGCLLT